MAGTASYILEADIVSFFDSIDRTMLMGMIRERIADESLMRLVGKCLHVGILDGDGYSEPDEGTTQGSATVRVVSLRPRGRRAANRTPIRKPRALTARGQKRRRRSTGSGDRSQAVARARIFEDTRDKTPQLFPL
jgi:hypothetical protein